MDYDDDDYVYPPQQQQQPMSFAPPQSAYSMYSGQAAAPLPPQQPQLFNPTSRPPMTGATSAPGGNMYTTGANNNNNNNNNANMYFVGGQPLNAIPTNQNVVLGHKGGYYASPPPTSNPNMSSNYPYPGVGGSGSGTASAAPPAGGSNPHLNISQSSWQTTSTPRVGTPSQRQPSQPQQFLYQPQSSPSLFRFDNSPNRAATPSQITSASRRESLPQTPTIRSGADSAAPRPHGFGGGGGGGGPSASFLGAVSTPPQLLLQPKPSPSRSPSQVQQQSASSHTAHSTPSRSAMGMPYQTPLRQIRPRGNAHGIVLRHQVAPDALPQPKPIVLPANGPALRPLLLLLPAVQEKLRDITPSPANYFDDVVRGVMLSMQDWIDECGGDVRFFTFHPSKNEASFVCVTGMYLRALQRIVGNNMDRCMVFLHNGLVSFCDVKQPIVAVETVQAVCGAQYTPVFSCSTNEVCILDFALGVAPPYFFINSRMS